MGSTQPSRWVRHAFMATLFLSALTGFAQMPIFKRYYIADIPGFGWLAQYYTTYALHYLSATAFIVLATYLAVNHLLLQRRTHRLSLAGYLRGAMLLLILATGVALVYRNLPGYRFSPAVVVALDFFHLGLVVVYLITSLAAAIARKRWVAVRV